MVILHQKTIWFFVGLVLSISLGGCNLSPINTSTLPDQSGNKPISPIQETKILPVQTSPTPGLTKSNQKLNIFLIAGGDNGRHGKRIGCGDSVVPMEVEIAPTTDITTTVKAALNQLFSISDKYVGQSGLYHSLAASHLQIDDISINNGNATIRLTGSLSLSGECDNPRVEAQLEATILQFPQISGASIYLNDKTLNEALSLSGN
jgi:hypothetical protein